MAYEKSVEEFSPGAPGEQVICVKDGLVTTTYAYRDIPFGDGSRTAKNIIAMICDHCGEVVGLPPESIIAMKAYRDFESLVTIRAGTMSGIPCLKGTRMPVYLVSNELEHGIAPKALVEAYPSLSLELVYAAGAYNAAHPNPFAPDWTESNRNPEVMETILKNEEEVMREGTLSAEESASEMEEVLKEIEGSIRKSGEY